MSVLEQLQATAGEPSGLPSVQGSNAFEQEMMMKMEANPIPGQSLTQDPDNRMPWETPPEFTDVQTFVDEAFLDITDPDKMTHVLDAMRSEVPVEYLAEQYLQRQVQLGKINPDVMMLSIEPIIYILLHQAAYAGIDPVLYPEDEMMEGEEEAMTQDLRNDTQSLMNEEQNDEVILPQMEAPSVVPKSLLERSEAAVKRVQGEN